MKIVWLLLAILLTCLTMGGVMAVAKRGDPIDLVMVVVIGFGAVACWRRTQA